MELLFLSFAILLTSLLFVLMILKLGKRSGTSNLPPGPWKLPFIGNLHQLVGSPPHRKFRDMATKYGPLMHLKLGEVPTIIISSPELAKEVMKTHDIIFSSRPEILASKILSYDSTNIGFSPYGEYWRQLRKICSVELLSPKQVQSFRPVREEEVSNLIDWIASKAGSVINLTDKVHSLVYAITARAAFGNKCKDQELFISLMKEASTVAAGFNIAEFFPSIVLLQDISGIKSQLERLKKEIDRILENIVNEHKNGVSDVDREDLVAVLLKVQEQGNLELPLTIDNIKAVISEVFVAGSETSATTIDWALSEMIKNPRVLKKVQAEVREVFNRSQNVDEASIDEMKYLKLVVSETLRLDPPVPLLLPRECGERCELNGFGIPLKAKVIINAWAIGRDPAYWTEPESFIPERFLDCSVDYKGTNFEYIPFGAGRRICPGMLFGLVNVEFPLALLLYYFDWKLPNAMKNEDLDMTEAFGITIRRRDDLHMIPIPYHPSPAA